MICIFALGFEARCIKAVLLYNILDLKIRSNE